MLESRLVRPALVGTLLLSACVVGSRVGGEAGMLGWGAPSVLQESRSGARGSGRPGATALLPWAALDEPHSLSGGRHSCPATSSGCHKNRTRPRPQERSVGCRERPWGGHFWPPAPFLVVGSFGALWGTANEDPTFHTPSWASGVSRPPAPLPSLGAPHPIPAAFGATVPCRGKKGAQCCGHCVAACPAHSRCSLAGPCISARG